MAAGEIAALQQLARHVLTQGAGSLADAPALAAATRRAYSDLAGVLVPLIGEVGVDALSARALHLAQREYPWLTHAGQSSQAEKPFDRLRSAFESQSDPVVAAEAAAAVLASFTALLATLIGEPLTMNLLRKAWPDGFSDARTEERRA